MTKFVLISIYQLKINVFFNKENFNKPKARILTCK